MIALLKKHSDRDTVRAECLKELQAFMADKTEAFVTRLFQIHDDAAKPYVFFFDIFLTK